MGWASATGLFIEILEAVKDSGLAFEARKELYEKIYDAFVDKDWDTQDEALGIDPAFDALYKEYYLDVLEDEESWDEGEDGC